MRARKREMGREKKREKIRKKSVSLRIKSNISRCEITNATQDEFKLH